MSDEPQPRDPSALALFTQESTVGHTLVPSDRPATLGSAQDVPTFGGKLSTTLGHPSEGTLAAPDPNTTHAPNHHCGLNKQAGLFPTYQDHQFYRWESRQMEQYGTGRSLNAGTARELADRVLSDHGINPAALTALTIGGWESETRYQFGEGTATVNLAGSHAHAWGLLHELAHVVIAAKYGWQFRAGEDHDDEFKDMLLALLGRYTRVRLPKTAAASGGTSFVYTAPDGQHFLISAKNRRKVVAYLSDADGNRARTPEGGIREYVGFLEWLRDGEIVVVSVEQPFRRKGVASALLALARQVEPRLRHSRNLTNDGRAWVDAVGARTARSLTGVRAYRGVMARLDARQRDEYLAACASGSLRVVADIVLTALAEQAANKSRWWDFSDNMSHPDDDAGRWWTSNWSQAWGYSIGNSSDYRHDVVLGVPVILSAQLDDALLGAEDDTEHGPARVGHIPPGVPLVIDTVECFIVPPASIDAVRRSPYGWEAIFDVGGDLYTYMRPPPIPSIRATAKTSPLVLGWSISKDAPQSYTMAEIQSAFISGEGFFTRRSDGVEGTHSGFAGWIETGGAVWPLMEHKDVPGGYLNAFSRGWVRITVGVDQGVSFATQAPLTDDQQVTLRRLFALVGQGHTSYADVVRGHERMWSSQINAGSPGEFGRFVAEVSKRAGGDYAPGSGKMDEYARYRESMRTTASRMSAPEFTRASGEGFLSNAWLLPDGRLWAVENHGDFDGYDFTAAAYAIPKEPIPAALLVAVHPAGGSHTAALNNPTHAPADQARVPSDWVSLRTAGSRSAAAKLISPSQLVSQYGLKDGSASTVKCWLYPDGKVQWVEDHNDVGDYDAMLTSTRAVRIDITRTRDGYEVSAEAWVRWTEEQAAAIRTLFAQAQATTLLVQAGDDFRSYTGRINGVDAFLDEAHANFSRSQPGVYGSRTTLAVQTRQTAMQFCRSSGISTSTSLDFVRGWLYADGTIQYVGDHGEVHSYRDMFADGAVRLTVVMRGGGEVAIEATLPPSDEQIDALRIVFAQSRAEELVAVIGMGYDTYHGTPGGVDRFLRDVAASGVTSTGNFDEPSHWWQRDAEAVVLNIPKMRTTAAAT